MKIKPEYTLRYEDDISIVQTLPDGTEREICPLSDTAAMAWEGIERGMDKAAIAESIVHEFDGAEPSQVAADLDALITQLIALGYAEE